jgi:photosystem II stability/assembly factor-like uncharacterized protein
VKRSLFLLAAFTACARGASSPAPATAAPQLTEQSSGTRALLQAVSPVNDDVVWVSGHRSTWARTTDGGTTWQAGAMTGADSTLQFRDVHAVSATVAYLLSAGNGAASRIYKTTDAGATWQLQFLNRDSAAFYDCFDFWDADHGIAVSDAVRGRMIVIATEDGGAHWTDISAALPPALEGEGAFAASGTCLVARGPGHAWIGTGAVSGARVYHTADRGRSWSVVVTPVVSGQAAGIQSLAFRDARHGLALGGRIADPNDRGDNVARSSDGGATWTIVQRTAFSGAAYGSAVVPGRPSTVVAAGPKGLDVSRDDGASWTSLNTQAYWAVAFASPRSGWAVGPAGRITKVSF